MENRILQDSYIACPFQVQMCDEQGGISLGTAFFYEFQRRTFLVTNWHNITGKHPLSGESLDSKRSPIFLNAKLPVRNEDAESPVGTTAYYLAAHKPANKIDPTPIPIEPGLKVVVIGFPRHRFSTRNEYGDRTPGN